MPNVTAPTRQMANGDVISQFIDSVGTSAVTYTYAKTQEKFKLRNIGQQSLSVTIAGNTQTVVAGDRWEKVVDFTSFSINAVSGNTAFDAWADEKGSTFDSAEGAYFAGGIVSAPSTPTPTTSTTTAANKYVPVAYKVGAYFNGLSAGDATHQTVTYKVRHNANLKCGLIRLMYANWYSGDTDGVNDITVGASIEAANGNIYPVTFNGLKKVTINPGTTIVSDPVAIFFEKGDTFYTRNYVSVATLGQKWPTGLPSEGATANEGIGQGDMTVSGAVTVSTSENYYHPINILGIVDPNVPNPNNSIIFIGDSITAGSGGTYFGNGHAQLSGAKWGRGITLAGLGSERGNVYANPLKSYYRNALAQYATHAVIMYGTNDIAGSLTVFQLQTDITTIANRLASVGVKVYVCTVLPRTTSTDAWATTINQTPTAGFEAGTASVRGKFNAWVRANGKVYPFTDYIDTADAVETGRDTGIWKASYTADGTHPNSTCYGVLSCVINMDRMFAGLTTGSYLPATPPGVNALTNDTVVNLSWNTVNEAKGYNIYRNSVKINGGLLTSPVYADTGLVNGSSYSYEVTAVDVYNQESTKSTATSAIPNVPTYVVYDSFTRADDAAILGSTESGTAGVKTWNVLSGTCGISTNQAYFPTGTPLAVVDAGVSNGQVEMKFAVLGSSPKLLFRAVDVNNHWFVWSSGGKYDLYKVYGNVFTLVRSSSGITATAGDIIRVALSGSSIRVFVNNVERTEMACTDSFSYLTTQHGLGGNNNAVRFDNFKVY